MELYLFKCLISNFKSTEAPFPKQRVQITSCGASSQRRHIFKTYKTIFIDNSPKLKRQCHSQFASVPGLVKLAHPPELITSFFHLKKSLSYNLHRHLLPLLKAVEKMAVPAVWPPAEWPLRAKSQGPHDEQEMKAFQPAGQPPVNGHER